MYSGITSGRVFDGELLYTQILEVNLFAFANRLFHRDFSLINGTLQSMSSRLERNLYETTCSQMQTHLLLESLCVCTFVILKNTASLGWD